MHAEEFPNANRLDTQSNTRGKGERDRQREREREIDGERLRT